MYYKVIFNDAIIDVAESPLDCCRYVPASQMVIGCLYGPEAMGIICERSGKYYQVEGWKEFPPEAERIAGSVTLEEIDEATYLQLKNVLDDDSAPGDTSLYEEIIAEDVPPNEGAPIVKTTAQLLREEIEMLKEQNKKLAKVITDLSNKFSSEG